MERKHVDATVFPTLSAEDIARDAAASTASAPTQPKKAVVTKGPATMKEAKRAMLLTWVCTAACAFLVFGRFALTGVQPTLIMYIAFGVLALCALAATEGYFRLKRKEKQKAEPARKRAKG